jgi:predicted transcriptional regulator of viral defense system
MQPVTKKILEQGLGNRILKVNQLSRVLGGTNAKRYGLVNRAVKSGELLRLQRGVYVLADSYRSHRNHPFSLAQALAPGSYISFETALSFYGWIPEKVYVTASVVPGRKSRYYEDERFGIYRFRSLAIEQGFFLELVHRHSIDGQTMLVASPCRALMDLVCLRKISWQGMGWLEDGLRLDLDSLHSIIRKDITVLKHVYKHKRMQLFLASLSQELNID